MKLKKNTSTLLRGLFQVFVVGALMLSMFVTSPVKAAGVDLVITGYTITPPNPAVGEAFNISVTIQNVGSVATASPVYRHVFVDTGDPNLLPPDPGTGCPDTDNYENYFRPGINQQIDPGGFDTRDIEVTSGLSTGGAHELWLYVDATCIESEDDETNNAFGPISFVLPGLSSGPTNVDVTIGGTSRGTYAMDPDESLSLKYPVTGGPVVISSDNGVGIIASLNQWRRQSAVTPFTGVAQSMALPVNLITDTYVIPRYVGNDPTLYNAILMANVDTVSRDITVTIGGIVRGTYTLAPSASQYAVFNGVVGGPVVVSSTSGSKIVASLYELKRGTAFGGWTGQSEMMGLPYGQLSNEYLIPIYFGDPVHIALDARLFIANADTVTRDITVTIGGVLRGTYTMAPNTSQSLKYPATGGPVVVSSPPGSRIIASLNQWRRESAVTPFTGVAQSMALPVSLITNRYVIPRYVGNDATLYNAVLMANVDTVSRVITVTIGGVVRGSYTLAPSASQFVVYTGVVGGPIVVSSVDGAKIVASLYELKRGVASGGWTGQSEMMGLPYEQLSDEYLIPIYFGDPVHVALDARLFIAVP